VLTPRQIVDAITFAESIASGRSISRAITDSTTFAETTARNIGRNRAITGTLTFAETPSRGLLIFARTAADAVTFAEVLASASSHLHDRWNVTPADQWDPTTGTRWDVEPATRW
jgi:hypothetical protein